MSYDSVSSDITTDPSIQSKATNNDDKTEQSWAQRVRNGVTSDKATTPTSGAPSSVQQNPIDASILSDLASSRVEVEDLKAQLSKMQAQQDNERQEQLRQAEHQRKEAEIQATAKQLEMDKKAEDQRRLFHQQMEDQRRELERLAAQQRQEMEAKMQEQITRAIQDHMNRSAAPVTPDLHRMFVNQGHQIQLLTRMMMTQMSPHDNPPRGQTSTGKRSAEETTTTDGIDDGSDLSDTECLNTPEVWKRVDLKRTLQKPASTRTEATTPSPSSPESPLRHRVPQQLDPHCWTPDSVSMVYPDNPNHPLHIGGDGPSDNEHESDTIMTVPRFSPFHATQSGEFDDVNITPSTQLEDIYLQQHDDSNRVIDSSQQEADPRTESRVSPHSPMQEDKTQPFQAKPEEEVAQDCKHEG